MRTRCTDLLSALQLAIDSASEQGRTEPDQPARAYLKTIAGDPEAVHLPANGYTTLFGLKVVLGPDGFHMTFEYPGISASEFRPRRAMEVDGSSVDIFPSWPGIRPTNAADVSLRSPASMSA
jgi:hypothetical protein